MTRSTSTERPQQGATVQAATYVVSKSLSHLEITIAMFQMSQGLRRAREPYRVKNMVTGLAISSFAIGVWFYSIRAVKQDNFDDVDEEARAMARAGVKPVDNRGPKQQ